VAYKELKEIVLKSQQKITTDRDKSNSFQIQLQVLEVLALSVKVGQTNKDMLSEILTVLRAWTDPKIITWWCLSRL